MKTINIQLPLKIYFSILKVIRLNDDDEDDEDQEDEDIDELLARNNDDDDEIILNGRWNGKMEEWCNFLLRLKQFSKYNTTLFYSLNI